MTPNLVKLALLSAALGLAACATQPVAVAGEDACVCKCSWARDRGEPATGTFTFATHDQTCRASAMSLDHPCRDEKGEMHVSEQYTDCRFVPAAAP